MTTVDVSESLNYGFKLFAYLLVVVVLGGGGMALGGALAGPIVLDGSVTEELSSPELLGGVVLAALGVIVWVTGTLGLTYKLLADAVTRGIPDDLQSAPTPEESPDQQQTPQQRRVEPVGPSPGEQTARSFGSESTVPGAADVSDRVTAPSDSVAVEPTTTYAGSDETPPETGPTAGESAGAAAAETADQEDETESFADDSPSTEERTAEEIAFGDSDEAGPDRQPSADDEDDVAVETEAPPDDTDSPDADDHTDGTETMADVIEDNPTISSDGAEDASPVDSVKNGDSDGFTGAGADESTDGFGDTDDDTPVSEPQTDDSGADELFSSEAGDSAEESVSQEENTEETDSGTEEAISDEDSEASDTDPLA
jgi:hypothetical protein